MEAKRSSSAPWDTVCPGWISGLLSVYLPPAARDGGLQSVGVYRLQGVFGNLAAHS